jgi:hypothetical protein
VLDVCKYACFLLSMLSHSGCSCDLLLQVERLDFYKALRLRLFPSCLASPTLRLIMRSCAHCSS